MPENTGHKSTSDVVQVTIGGRRYRLRGSDPSQLERLAATVDRTLEEIAGPGAPTDDFKVAVLAALNLAGDHEDLRAAWLEQARELQARARRLEARAKELRESGNPASPV